MLLLYLLLISSLHSLTFTIPSGDEMCFFEELETDETLKGSFQIVRGGDRLVDFIVCFYYAHIHAI